MSLRDARSSRGQGQLFDHEDEVRRRLELSGLEVIERRELANGLRLVVRGADGVSVAINVYYSGKKGLSIVPSGGDAALQARIGTLFARRAASTGFPVIGQDEAGKGDYFGSLVVAGFHADERVSRELTGMGVSDSKTLSNSRVLKLAARLRADFDGFWSVVSIPPEEYNLRFGKLRESGMNSLDLLAEAHAEALERLLESGLRPRSVVIDMFCSRKRLDRHLRDRPGLEIILRERAESEPAVAAASILARAAYLESLEALGRESGLELVPGSGREADAIGSRLLARVGEEALGRFAKLHFRNTLRLRS
ncbi:hypothetical protein JW921_10845 [Candidatus Fermentibacterales bacterium]|nr:hypothetical protein [Candidatus Fermentibacterales bacterium]